MSQILRKFTTVPVKGARKFVVEVGIKRANIGWFGDNFRRHFLGMIEENVEDGDLAIQLPTEPAHDTQIMAELGDFAKIKLAHFFGLLEKQANGGSGPLITDRYANICYHADEQGKDWSIGASWNESDGYWHVESFSMECPVTWSIREQILSLDSCE